MGTLLDAAPDDSQLGWIVALVSWTPPPKGNCRPAQNQKELKE
jgi:hypothetical protein